MAEHSNENFLGSIRNLRQDLRNVKCFKFSFLLSKTVKNKLYKIDRTNFIRNVENY